MARGQLERNSGKTSESEQGLKLLLVDEDANDLDYYSEVLRYLGYEVQPVDSYDRAAAMLRHEQFDLVIVDQGSSNFEGRSVLSRAIEVDSQAPVLVLTRTVNPDCCLEALDAGAREYVQKPLTAAEVRELVGDYLKPAVTISRAGRGYPVAAGVLRGNADGASGDAWRKAS